MKALSSSYISVFNTFFVTDSFKANAVSWPNVNVGSLSRCQLFEQCAVAAARPITNTHIKTSYQYVLLFCPFSLYHLLVACNILSYH